MSQLVPPVATTVMPTLAETLFTVVTGVPMLIVLGIAISHLPRRRGPLLLFCFVGGGLASLFEPVADILSCLYFPALGQHTAFETLGRPIPWALVFAYPWYVGGQGYLAYKLFAKRVSPPRIWQLWAVFALTNVLVETPGVLTGFHIYYGNQPFNFWGFPLWQASVQSIMPMAAGALIYAVHARLGNGWRLVAVVPLVPMADGLVNAGLALPIWTTLGSDLPLAANYIGGLLTIGMAAVAVWVLTVVLGRTDQPTASQRSPEEIAA
ncbi:MAG: hypothetical protein JWQ60_2417 [Pseudonocardia sp.]|jgi:hypothetical protein|nr:hypothetical protein [Pseudonocardia sp.]MDT7564011.1 hypothetical protein [Pseudonocardiales bacterium]